MFSLLQPLRSVCNRRSDTTHGCQQTRRNSPFCIRHTSREDSSREDARCKKHHSKYPEKKPFQSVLADCQRKSFIYLPPIRRSELHAQTILAANRKKIPPFRPALPQRHGHVEQPASFD